jgi:uncharacterized protein (TIGR01777 family)
MGVVLTPQGGALARLLPIFRLGLGARLGHGRQVMSWVALDDAVGALHHLMVDQRLSGPVNVTAPAAVTNAAFTATLGRVLRRPAFLAVPGFAITAAFGQMGRALLLEGARVLPRRLTEAGFVFRHPELGPALAGMLIA